MGNCRHLFIRGALRQPATVVGASSLITTATTLITKRSHMNHGGGTSMATFEIPSGPRTPYVPLGLEVTKHTGNMLRLLESSHQYGGNKLSSSVWHMQCGQYWMRRKDDDEKKQSWIAYPPDEPIPVTDKTTKSFQTLPKVEYMTFADECTALIKITGNDGLTRYLSLLKLMEIDDNAISQREITGGPPFLPNDGWLILREVAAPSDDDNTATSTQILKELLQTIETYWNIEHGGGMDDRYRAEKLFHPQARLVSVGMTHPDEYQKEDEWSAPLGNLLDISLETYLQGVESQTPHGESSSTHDTIVNIDVSGNSVAAVTVTVGNGACNLLFRDHLLLGRDEHNGSGGHDASSSTWKILSKTFSPQPWPQK